MMSSPGTLAIDIGGTKFESGWVAPDGTLSSRHRRDTPRGASAEDLWGVVVELADAAAEGRRPGAVGVGCGGPMSAHGELVSPLNIGGWREFPLRARLGELIGVPVVVDNDAKALAVGEHHWGAAQGVENFIAMVVSTGVGGGIFCDGRLLDGAAGNAGHIGHLIVEPDGHVCGCGATGCLEAEASGTAIARITGAPAAAAGHDVRVRTGRMVGRAVACVANLLDVQLAVVAGSVALGYGSDFFDAANEELAARARLDFSTSAVIRPAGLGDEGPLLGAAALTMTDAALAEESGHQRSTNATSGGSAPGGGD